MRRAFRARSTTPPRRRWLLPAGCCLLLGGVVTVEGGCLPIDSGGGGVTAPPATLSLASRYVLQTVGGQPLPAVVGQTSDGTVVRVVADTLVLAPGGTAASGTFDEVAVVRRTPPGQPSTESTVRLAGRAYTREPGNNLRLAAHAVLDRATPGTAFELAPGVVALQLFGAAPGPMVYQPR
jgi:hypothetical protein